MKKRLLISLIGISMLISLAQVGIISAVAVNSQQKSQFAENINENGAYASPLVIGAGAAAGHTDSPIYRAGTVPTALVAQASTATVRVGDTVTASGKLVNKNTGAGIPGATLIIQFSFDGNNWMTVTSVTTDSNGGVGYTSTIPDPRLFGYQLPLTVYGRVVYAGDETYAASASTYAVTVLPPS
jgi:hypothetical protein